MIEFFASLTLFFAAHIVPTRTGLRAFIAGRLGERGYIILYSLTSIAILAWVNRPVCARPSYRYGRLPAGPISFRYSSCRCPSC